MRKVSTALMWMFLPSCTYRVFTILGEVGLWTKVTIQDPSTLSPL